MDNKVVRNRRNVYGRESYNYRRDNYSKVRFTPFLAFTPFGRTLKKNSKLLEKKSVYEGVFPNILSITTTKKVGIRRAVKCIQDTLDISRPRSHEKQVSSSGHSEKVKIDCSE